MLNIDSDQAPPGATVDTETPAEISAPKRRLRLRLLVVSVSGALIAGGIAFGIGFMHFVDTVSGFQKPEATEAADAIVALTGGADRINDAMALLNEGRARRLLISGVNPSTSREALASLTLAPDFLFSCCVDLGHSALNTVGNAKEARDWMRGNGFHSLIVVTSSYHLPRSLNEIARELPEARLIPHAVVTEKMRAEDWWHDPDTARLLLSEFAKYLMSIARVRFKEPTAFTEMTRSAAHAGE